MLINLTNIIQIWMFLDINITKAIGKFFKGRREDVEDFLEMKNLKADFKSEKQSACINILT